MEGRNVLEIPANPQAEKAEKRKKLRVAAYSFDEKYHRKKLPYFLDNEKAIIKPAGFFFRERYCFVESIMAGKTTFLQEFLKLLGIKHYQRYHAMQLEEFLAMNLGQYFYTYKNEHEKIIEMVDLRSNGVLKKSLKLLNAYLEVSDIPYSIVSKRDLCRNSSNFKKVYWEICSKN